MKQLSFIKYTGTDGEKKSFRLIIEVQNSCHDLGTELDIDQPILKGLKNSHACPTDFCKEVFQTWIQRGEDVNWERLLQALKDIKLGGIAQHLQRALMANFQGEQDWQLICTRATQLISK